MYGLGPICLNLSLSPCICMFLILVISMLFLFQNLPVPFSNLGSHTLRMSRCRQSSNPCPRFRFGSQKSSDREWQLASFFFPWISGSFLSCSFPSTRESQDPCAELGILRCTKSWFCPGPRPLLPSVSSIHISLKSLLPRDRPEPSLLHVVLLRIFQTHQKCIPLFWVVFHVISFLFHPLLLLENSRSLVDP